MNTLIDSCSKYKIRLIGSNYNKDSFTNKPTCSMTISLGQENQIGDRLGATLSIINREFSSCTFMLCDTLNRHNIEVINRVSCSQAYEVARKEGDEWLEKSKIYISKMSIPTQIIRWDAWLLHSLFKPFWNKINTTYNENKNFKQAIDHAVSIYIDRISKRFFCSVDKNFLITSSKKYLLEECAVMLIWAENKYNFEIYPAKRNLALAATYEFFIKNQYHNVLAPVCVEIRSRIKKVKKEIVAA